MFLESTPGRHIPIIKRYIQTIKRGKCYTTHSMSYKRYKKLVTGYLVECIIHSRNSFPQEFSISNRLGPNKILLENPSPDFNMNIILFRSYAIVTTGTTNTLNIIKIPGIPLGYSNEDIGHLFM